MLKRLTLAAMGATLLAGAAQAQDGPQDRPRPPHDPLAMLDLNKDGVVTRDEMMADVAKRFAAMDTNHDGKVSAEERRAYAEKMRPRMGGDRELTLAEEQARAGKMFDMIDTNHDGKIDASEREAARQRMMAMRGRHGPPPPPPGGGDMPPPPPQDGPEGN